MRIYLKTLIQLIIVFTFSLNYEASARGQKFTRVITVKNGPEKIKDAVVEVLLNNSDFDYSKTKPGGTDLRFSIGKKLKGTGLSYWIEQWNEEGLSTIWLKIPVLLPNQELKVIMYYGDDTAAPISSGTDTFLFFDDFDDADLQRKWINTSIGEAVEQQGILKLKESDGQDGIITAKFKLQDRMIVRSTYKRENADEHWTRAGIGAWNNYFCFGDHTEIAGTGINYIMIYSSESLSNLKSMPLVKVANGKITNEWRRIAFAHDGYTLQGSQDETKVQWAKGPTSDTMLSLRVLDNDAWDNFKYISVSPYSKVQPITIIGEEQPISK